MGSEDYEPATLEDMANILDSQRVPVKKADRKPGPYPYYGASGIADYVNDYIFDGDYLLLAEDGENLKTKNTPIAFMASGKFWVNNHAHILKAKDDNNTNYICYALQVADIDSYLSGSTRPKLTQGDMKRVEVPKPSGIEQRAIAHILGTLDDKIDLNRRMNETLEGMAQALFKSWFVDFDPVIDNALKAGNRIPSALTEKAQRRQAVIDRTQDVNTPTLPDHIQSLFPNTFQPSELGPIPEGWVTTNLGDEIDFQTGFSFKSKSFTTSPPGVHLARGMNVKEGVFFWGNQTRYWPNVTPEIEKYLLQSGDVLIGMDGSKVGKNWVRVRTSDLPCLLVQRVARLRKVNSIGENFIWITVGSERFRSYVDTIKTGTSIPHISGKQIKSYDFIRPPVEENVIFESFESITSGLIEKADSNLAETNSLTHLRDTLLPKLISGELRVPDVENFVEDIV